jgi:hypothetical protein
MTNAELFIGGLGTSGANLESRTLTPQQIELICNEYDALKHTITRQRRIIAALTKERDEWRDRADSTMGWF